MSLSHLEVLVLYLLTGAVMATLLVVIGLWAWAIRRLLQGDPLLSQKPILPMQPARWGGRTVLAVILLYIGVNLVVGLGFGVAAGLRRPAPPTQVAAPLSEERPAPEIEAARGLAVESEVGPTDEGEDEHSEHRSPYNAMLLNSLASLLFVVTLPVVLQGSAGVAVEELGFSWKEWPLQVGVGAIAALLTVPVVYAVQSLAVQIWDVREHPVQQMMADGMSPGVAALAVVSTVFLAPMVEESLFRGVILGWLTRIFTQVSTSSLNVRESEGGGEPASGTFPATRQNESSPDAQPHGFRPCQTYCHSTRRSSKSSQRGLPSGRRRGFHAVRRHACAPVAGSGRNLSTGLSSRSRLSKDGKSAHRYGYAWRVQWLQHAPAASGLAGSFGPGSEADRA